MRTLLLFCVFACAPRPEEPCVIVRVPGATTLGEAVIIRHTGKCPNLFAANALRTDERVSALVTDAGVQELRNLPAGLYELEDNTSRLRSFVVYNELSTAELRLPRRCFTLGIVDGGFGCDDRRATPGRVGPSEVPDGGGVVSGVIHGHFERCGLPFLEGRLNTAPDSGALKAASCSEAGVFAWGSSTTLTRTLPDGGARVDQLPAPTAYLALRFVGNQGMVVTGVQAADYLAQFWCRTASSVGELECDRFVADSYANSSVGFNILSSTGTSFGANRNYLGTGLTNIRALPPMEDSPGTCGSTGLELDHGFGFRFESSDSELCVMVDETGAYGVRYPQEPEVEFTIRAAGFLGPYLWASDWTTTSLFRIPGR